MRTITETVYKFDELSEAAKQKAISDYRNIQDNSDMYDEINDTREAFMKLFGINETGRGFRMYTFPDNWESITGVRLRTLLLNNYGTDLYKGKYYSKLVDTYPDGTKIEVSKEHPAGLRLVRKHSKVFSEHCCVLTGVCYDEAMLQPIYDFIQKPVDGPTLEDLCNECFDAIEKAANDEAEARGEDAYIIEEIEANDYEFYENGEML